MREDGRKFDEIRPFSVIRPFNKYAEGSVLVSLGETKVKFKNQQVVEKVIFFSDLFMG